MLKIRIWLFSSKSKKGPATFSCKGEFSGHEQMKRGCIPGMVLPQMATTSFPHRRVRAPCSSCQDHVLPQATSLQHLRTKSHILTEKPEKKTFLKIPADWFVSESML